MADFLKFWYYRPDEQSLWIQNFEVHSQVRETASEVNPRALERDTTNKTCYWPRPLIVGRGEAGLMGCVDVKKLHKQSFTKGRFHNWCSRHHPLPPVPPVAAKPFSLRNQTRKQAKQSLPVIGKSTRPRLLSRQYPRFTSSLSGYKRDWRYTCERDCLGRRKQPTAEGSAAFIRRVSFMGICYIN